MRKRSAPLGGTVSRVDVNRKGIVMHYRSILILSTLLLVAAAACTNSEQVMEEKCKAEAERFFNAVFNEGDVGTIKDSIAPGYEFNGFPSSASALEQSMKALLSNFEGLPKLTVDSLIAEGNTVAIRWSAKVKMAVTGEERTLNGTNIISYNDEIKATKNWLNPNPPVNPFETAARQFFNTVYNEGNLDVIKESIASGYTYNGVVSSGADLEKSMKDLMGNFDGLPKVTIASLVAEGNTLAIRWVATAKLARGNQWKMRAGEDVCLNGTNIISYNDEFGSPDFGKATANWLNPTNLTPVPVAQCQLGSN